MRNFYLTFILLYSIVVSAQIQPDVLDNFSDGNFSENPVWSGTTDLFAVTDGQLVVNEYTDGNAYLSTPSRIAINATWEMDLTTKNTTSGSNLIKFYLISDNPNLTGELNGYFVMFGDKDDEIVLYKQQGKDTSRIISGRKDISENAIVRVKVTNDDKGNFSLFSKNLSSESEFTEEGSFFDEDFLSKNYYVGVYVKYTKTWKGNYLFDNLSVSGEKVVDTTPPIVESFNIVDKNHINIVFSEQVNVSSALPEGIEKTTLSDAKNTLLIELQEELNEGESRNITLPSITDLEENELEQKSITIYLPKSNDVIFNEIMADPNPQVALPEAKYIELYNRTDFPISLKDWQLSIGSKNHIIENGIIDPKSYLLICLEKDASLFEVFSPLIFASNISSMTISGTQLLLTSNLGTIIDFVQYSDSWYGTDEFKKDGGWSLERIDVNNLYPSKNNWKVSIDKRGGTPCQQNSIAKENPDSILPTIKSYHLTNDTIVVTFSKSMQKTDLLNIDNYSLASGIVIKSTTVLSVLNNEVFIELEEPIDIDIIDTLTIEKLRDVSGLEFEGAKLPIASPQKPTSFNDIIINEILFNPIGDGADFVEIYNPTETVWNLSEIFVTTRKEEELQKRISITDKSESFFPNEYIVLTKDPENIKTNYSCPKNAKFHTVALPSLPDAEGNIVLVAKDETIFDEFNYTEKMHHAFVSNKEGVSLERINPSLSTQSNDSWQSAASVVGYATPGYKNSQYYDNKPEEVKKHFELLLKDKNEKLALLEINIQIEQFL